MSSWSAIALAIVTTVPLQAQEDGRVFEVERLAPGVWAATVLPNPPMYVWANALVVEQSDGLVVVDSHSSPSAARAMIEVLASLSDRPVRRLVNTHFHSDHVYGNETYVERWPRIEIWAQENTTRDVDARIRPFVQEELEGLQPRIEQREEWLRTGLGPQGQELTEEQIRTVEYSLRVNRRHYAELQELEVVPPNHSFATEATLPDPERPVRLMHFGPAHTEGDAVVYLPEQRILAVGDLLEDALPWVDENTHPVGWADTLDELVELDVDFILPSHGELYRDTTVLDRQRAFFRALVDRTRELHDQGASVERAQERIESSSIPAPLPEDHPAMAGFEEYLTGVIGHIYRDLGGSG